MDGTDDVESLKVLDVVKLSMVLFWFIIYPYLFRFSHSPRVLRLSWFPENNNFVIFPIPRKKQLEQTTSTRRKQGRKNLSCTFNSILPLYAFMSVLGLHIQQAFTMFWYNFIVLWCIPLFYKRFFSINLPESVAFWLRSNWKPERKNGTCSI